MKILYIHHRGERGGSPSSLIHLIDALPKENVEIYIASPKGDVIDDFKRITSNIRVLKYSPPFIAPIEGVKWNLLRNIWNNRKAILGCQELKYHIKDIKPDIVHLNDFGLFVIARYAKSQGCKVVLHARTVISQSKWFFKGFIGKWINRYCSYTIFITKSVQNQFPKIDNSAVIYNIVHQTSSIKSIPKKQKKENKEIVCLFAANFVYAKGIYDLLEVVKLSVGKPIKFLIAGCNPRPMSYYESFIGRILITLNIYPNIEADIKKKIAENNLLNVELLGFSQNIKELFNKTDIVIAPEHSNSTPRIVYEAGLYQIPSILSLKGKFDDIVIDGHSGILVGIKSPYEIFKAIEFFINNPNEIIRMGRNARNQTILQNSADKCGQKMMEVYESLIKI